MLAETFLNTYCLTQTVAGDFPSNSITFIIQERLSNNISAELFVQSLQYWYDVHQNL